MSSRVILTCFLGLCIAGCTGGDQRPEMAATAPDPSINTAVVKLEGSAEQALAQRNNEKAIALALAALRAAERGEISDAEALLGEAAAEAVQLAPLLEQVQRLLTQLAAVQRTATEITAAHAQEISALRDEIDKRDQAIKRLRDLTLQQ